tara:strand:+ start:11694 stop:20894 length:9201 start_codon:yes stop_codon:yes gene_type:complete
VDYNQPTGNYNPHYNEEIVRQLLKQYERTPSAFNERLIAQMHEDANFYGLDVPHQHPEEEFSLSETIKQAGAGFITGFTTFNVGDEPRNTAERIANNIGNLAGFVGYMPSLPAKAGLVANAARALKGKSIPMLISNKATEAVSKVASDVTRKAVDGRAGAFKSAAEFVQKTPVKNTLEGAFHLGVASTVSAWQGGIDEMMNAFIGGAQTGAIFRVIGNAIRLPGAGVPRMGAKWGELTPEQQAEKSLRALSASLFMGLPATLRGETAPEQIYEYLLGAYFGFNEMPGEIRRRDKALVELFKQSPKDNQFKLPELIPSWEKLSPREQKLVKEERDKIWDERGSVISHRLQTLLGQSFAIPEFKEEQKILEVPEPKTEIQFNTRDRLSSGKDIEPEVWKTLSKEDKEYYSKSAEGLGFRGLYTWTEVTRWDRNELESVARILKIKGAERLDDLSLASEIIYNQRKDLDGIGEVIATANKTDSKGTIHQDIGERLEFEAVETRSVSFVKNFLEPYFEKLSAFDKHQTIRDLSREIEFQVYEFLNPPEGKKPDSREFMKWAETRFKTDFPDEAHGSMRQWFKLASEANQVPFISPRVVESTELGPDGKEQTTSNTYVDFLSTTGTPVDAQGNTKLLRFPKNRLDMIGEEIFTDKAPTYMIADNFILSDGSGSKTMSFFRYKQQLERDFSNDVFHWEGKYPDGKKVFHLNPDGSRRKEGHNLFYERFYDIMSKMAQNDYFYFGGAGDKERAYFVRKHPNTLEKLDTRQYSGQLGEILKAMHPTKGVSLFKRSEEMFLEQYNIKSGSELYEQAKDYHARSFVSNYLWDLHQQGFKVPDWNQHGIVERRQLILRGLEEGLINNPKDYNKRAQIWFTNGFRADSEFIDTALPRNLKLSTNKETGAKEYNVLIVKDAEGKNLTDLSEAYRYIEATDGAILTHDKLVEVEARESGMPMPKEQGQSKSFIVSPSEQYGAMLGKYMKHSAGETLSKAMEEYVDPVTGEVTPIHMIMYESAIKQMGSRKGGDYSLENGVLKSSSEIFKFRPEEQHTVLSELQNEHYVHPQGVPTQMLSNLSPSTMFSKPEQEVLNDMVGTLVDRSYYSTNLGESIIGRLKSNPQDARIHVEFIKNFKEMGVNDVIEILRTPDLAPMHDMIYREIARVSKENLSEMSMEGEFSFEDVEAANSIVREFTSGTQRVLELGAEVGGKYNVPTLGTMLYKHTNPYIEVIMNNWIVNKATRPVVDNSASARMRPYDLRMRQKFPDLKENEFYLDNYFRTMPIGSSLKEKTLGEIWDAYSRYNEVQKATADKIFRSVTTRVPMDSVSGAQVLIFKGFTGRKGHGILLHPKVMRAEGGADLDGDKAFIFMGGKEENGMGGGFKQSWMDMYEANKGEYTRYISKDKKTNLSKEEYDKVRNKEDFEPYTTDNKNEPLRHPKYGNESARDLFTAKAQESVDPLWNQMLYYSPFGRQRMSEAASMGRFLLGDVVIMKKNMAGAHSMISAMPGGKHVATKTLFIDGERVDVAFETVAKQNKRDIELFRQLSRTGVALGSDPMNEAGLAHYNKFFNHLHESLFRINIIDVKTQNKETGKMERVPKEELDYWEESLLSSKEDPEVTGMYPAQKFRNGGIYQMFSDANNAYFGRNWMENRRHTFPERRRKAEALANIDAEFRNTIQPKIASLLSKVEYEESLISRLDPKKVDEIYKAYDRVYYKYSPLRKALERKGFVVKKNKYLDEIIEKELWKEENKREHVENTKKFEELFKITEENLNKGEAEGDAFKYVNPHVKLKFRNPVTGELFTFIETLTGARPTGEIKNGFPVMERLNTGKTQEQWMRYHIDALVEKVDHMFQQDMADMISISRIAEASKGLSEQQIIDITTEASNIRGLDKVLNKNRRRITVDPTKNPYEALWERELDAEVNRLGARESSLVTQAEIEMKTREAQEKYNSKERALFDEFLMGTVHRSNKKQVDEMIDKMAAQGRLTDEMERFLLDKRKRTDETSLTQFAFRNRAIGDKVIKDWIRDYNDKFNLAMGLPTVKDIQKMRKETEVANETQLIEGSDGKKVEVNILEDPFKGLRGLKDGKLDREGEKILTEAEENIVYYHNSFGAKLPEIVAAVVKKDLDAMTYEDWRVFNRTFKRLRTQSMWDMMFNAVTKGKPEIMKRYYWLFPETIDRRLMFHDFQTMKKVDIVMDKEGHFRDKVVQFPIHQMGKEQHIMGATQQSMASAAEQETDKFRRVLNPLIDGVPEGRKIYDLATTQMELGTAKYLTDLAIKQPENAKKYHAQAQEYYKNYNSLRAEIKEADLMAKVYEVPIVDAKGHTEIRKMTGSQYKQSMINLLSAQNKLMHSWLTGNPKYKEMFLSKDAKGNVRSFHKEGKEGFEKYNVEKFVEFMEDYIVRGKDLPRDIGMDVIRGIVRQYQFNMAKDAKHMQSLSEMRITPTKNIPFEHYIPHILLDQKKATKTMLNSIKSIMNTPDNVKSEKHKAMEIQKILFHHHQVTGDWMTPEIKQWELYDNVRSHLETISDKMTPDQLRSYNMYARPGVSQSRVIHMEGWSNEPRIYDKYMRSVFGSYYRSIGQLLARDSMDKFVKEYEPKWGEGLTRAWEKFIGIYINNASGFPAILPPEYLNDPYLNVRGTPYAWWADNNVRSKINKVLDKFELTDKEMPKEMRGVSLEDIRNWSNLEAKWQLASLLAHPKTAIGNVYGGTALTIANTGFGNFRKARDINWLRTKLNPGKDKFGNEWHGMPDVTKYITNLGVVPEMITYEAGIHPEVRKANVKAFFDKAIAKIKREPDVKDSTLRGMMQEYGLADSFWNKSAYFMRTSERVLRRDSFMAHLIQAWQNYGGALPHDHPVLIEHAKRGVKATQFLYNAPFRPLFAQTQLGKVLTRFQLWSWNSVRFRNDVIREAANHGFREGTPEFERFRRTAQLDMFMLALSSVFMYSLFEAALPAPWNWFQDTADWIFGNEKERDRAFFGAWPSQVAPLQMVTPPVARMLPATFKGLVEQDWSKLSDYVVWTMFPFGRLARDVVGPNGIIENPARSVEKITGLPYVQFGKTMKEEREKEKLFPEGILNW